MAQWKLLLMLALLVAPAAQATYKCKDEKGFTHIGDTPPAGCANVVMYEITRSGAVIRKIDPTPTGDQIRLRQEEAARQKEEEKAAGEQRRKDMALLATYSSEKDIDTSRDLNLKPIEVRMKSARDRVVEVEKREKELDEEMEFYTAGKGKTSKRTRAAPQQLLTDIERTKHEKEALAKSVASYEKEMHQVRERYDIDKKRWVELKQLHREGKLDLRDPREIEAAKKTDPSKPAVKKYNLYIVPVN